MKLLACVVFALAGSPSLAQAVDADRVVRPYWWDMPVVEALGRSRLETSPNRASFDASFVETNGNSSKAMESAVARAKAAQSAIRSLAGDSARIKTTVTVAPYFEQYRDKDGEMIENERADRVKGYEARATLDVTLTDTALAGKARAAALALGPQESGEISFSLEETPEQQLAAYKAAVSNARTRAETAAAAIGKQLGDVLVLQEGSASCLGNWSGRQVARQIDIEAPRDARGRSVEDISVVVTANSRDRIISAADIARLDLESDYDPVYVSSAVCMVYAFAK